MKILAFVIVICYLVLIAWCFGFFSPSAPTQKHRSKNLPQKQLPSKALESQEQNATVPLGAQVQDKTPISDRSVFAPRQFPVSRKPRTRPLSTKHQQNIQRGDHLLQQLRSEATPVGLPMVIATLRRMNNP